MNIVDFSKQNSVINQYVAELRDVDYQKNRKLFRENLIRIGQMMAFEVSKTLNYQIKEVTTPLGVANTSTFTDDIVVATIFRAGLPFHQGFLDVFDKADNAFVSAYRYYMDKECEQVGIKIEYIASPDLNGKTLIIADPMLATGGSMAAAYEALLKTGKPSQVHIACVIGTPEGVDVLKQTVSADTTLWCAAIDPGMNEHKYIVPGFGDAGDLCYGEKL